MTIHNAVLSRRSEPVPAQVDVIYNPKSGRPDNGRYIAELKSALLSHFSTVRVHEVSAEASPTALTRAALASGGKNFVGVGGDGTIAAVATELRGHDDISLTVAPGGTANAFAAALCLPRSASAVADSAASGQAREVDIATVETESFHGSVLLLTGVGLEAEAVAETRRTPWLKRIFGTAGYALAALRCVFWRRTFRANIVLRHVRDGGPGAPHGSVESDKICLKGVNLQAITVANAAPPTSVLAQGIGHVAPDDGLLEVVCVSPRSVVASLVAFADMLRGALLNRRVVRNSVFGLRARSVEITCDPPQRVVVDGEDAGLTPVVVELREEMSRINVVAPPKGNLRRRRRRLRRTLQRLWRNVRGVGFLVAAVWVARNYEHIGRCGVEDEDGMA